MTMEQDRRRNPEQEGNARVVDRNKVNEVIGLLANCHPEEYLDKVRGIVDLVKLSDEIDRDSVGVLDRVSEIIMMFNNCRKEIGKTPELDKVFKILAGLSEHPENIEAAVKASVKALTKTGVPL